MAAIWRVLRIVVLVIVSSVLLVLTAAWVVSQTSWGRARALEFAERIVKSRINGTITAASIAPSSDLFTGVELIDVNVWGPGPDSVLILHVDRVHVAYRLLSFLKKSVELSRVTLHGPDFVLERLPGDTLWNVQRLALDTMPPAAAGEGPATLIEFRNATIVDGRFVVRQAVEGEPGTWAVIDATDAGPVRVFRFEGMNATLPRVRISSPDEPGIFVEVESLPAVAHIMEEPLRVQDARGTVTFLDSLLHLDLSRVQLPNSLASVRGTVTVGHETILDLEGYAEPLVLRDVRWAEPRIPEWGQLHAAFTVRTLAEGIEVMARDARFTAPGTQVAGTLGVVVGDVLRARGIDVRLSPVDIALLDEWIPDQFPAEGNLMGTLRADGPLAAVRTDGNVQWVREGQPAFTLRWNGTAGWQASGPSARQLEVAFSPVDLVAFADAGLDARIDGVVNGNLVLDGSLAQGLDVHGEIEHTAPGGAVSRFDGGGRIARAEEDVVVDLELYVRPLALSTLAPLAPALDSLRGQAEGTLVVAGTPRDLRVGMDVATDGGHITGNVHVTGTDARRFAGELNVASLRPRVLLPHAPDLFATFGARFDVTGTSLADLTGNVVAALDTAHVARLPLRSARAVLVLADGIARVDTLFTDAAGASLRAHGSFGLVTGRSGTIEVTIEAPELERLEPVLFPEPADDPAIVRIAGTARGTASITGSIEDFSASASLDIERAQSGDNVLHAAGLVIEATGIRTDSIAAQLALVVDSLFVSGRAFDSTRVAATWTAAQLSAQAFARQPDGNDIRVGGSFRRVDDVNEVHIAQLQLGEGPEAWALRDSALIRISGGRAEVTAFHLARADEAGNLTAQGHLSWQGEDAVPTRDLPLDFTADLANVPMIEFLRLFGFDTDAGGTVEGNARITGTARAPVISANLGVDRFSFGEAQLDSLGARFEYATELAQVHVGGFRDGRSIVAVDGRVPLNLQLRAGVERRLAENLDLTIRADTLPAALLLGFLEPVSNVQGVVIGQVSVAGTPRNPEISGAFVVRGGAATIAQLGVRYQRAIVQLYFNGSATATVDVSAVPVDLRGRGEGSVRVDGAIDLTDPANPGFDLRVQPITMLAARRRDVEATVSGSVRIGGEYRRPIITGGIIVDRGTVYLDEIYRQYLLVGLEDPLLADVIDTTLVSNRAVLPPTENPFLRNLRVDSMSVTVTNETWLRSREMDVEVVTNQPLTVDFDRQTEDLTVSGTLAVVRGRYTLDFPPFARQFQVRSGTVNFPGTPGLDDVSLNVTAEYTARTRSGTLDIQAVLTGSLASPRVRLMSEENPTISESDLASYLFFGEPTYAFNFGQTALGGGTGEGSIFGNVGLGSLRESGLGYVASGLQTLAQNLGIVDYVGLSAAEGSPGAGGILANTEISLGRYLTPDLFVSYTQRIGTPGAQPGVRLEWRLDRTFTAELFAEDRFARNSSFSIGQTTAAQRVFGFFFRGEWGY
jgi:hypothetical protein